MPESQTIVFLLGIAIGGSLLAFGGWLGYRWGLRKGRRSVIVDREAPELLGLVDALSEWTADYQGSVTQYNEELSSATEAMQQASSGDAIAKPIVKVLDDIMLSNQTLRDRLDDAERQLDKQKQDIEAYLTEARTDALTSLPNRRAFDQRLDELFIAWRKGSHGFAVVLIDIDKFKNINDRYGHPEGDAVLRQVADLMREHLSGAYIVARFGGEEFAALLPIPVRVAAERVDRMRRLIASEFVNAGDHSIKVSVSAGISEAREDKLIGPIVRRADEALYAAKGTGRNRVYFHDGSQPVLVGTPEVAV